MSDSSKKIIYILIAQETLPLAGYSTYNGSFVDTCIKFLAQVKKDASAQVRTETDYKILYINENNITYLIMASNDYPKETGIGCLESVKKEFQSTYPGRENFGGIRFGLDDELREKLEMKFNYYNKNPNCTDEILQKLHEEIVNMKDEVINSLELLNERGGKLELVSEKAENLAEDSQQLKVKAKNVRKSEWRRKLIVTGGIILVILILVYVIVCISCSSFTFNCSS